MDLLGILRIKDSNGNWVSVPGLKGDTGEPFKILGIYATAAALEADVTDPEVGDVYLVGTTGAYDIYLYLLDGWHNTGRYMPKGDQGDPAPQSAITSAVETWLAANVDPTTGYVLDRTLTQENAAAPADLVGDLKSDIDALDASIYDTTAIDYIRCDQIPGATKKNGSSARSTSYITIDALTNYDSYYKVVDEPTTIWFEDTSSPYVSICVGENYTQSTSPSEGVLRLYCSNSERYRKSENNLPTRENPITVPAGGVFVVTVTAGGTDLVYGVNTETNKTVKSEFAEEIIAQMPTDRVRVEFQTNSVILHGEKYNVTFSKKSTAQGYQWNITALSGKGGNVLPSSTDIIGVLQFEGENNFMGGVHGNENNTEFSVWSDGKQVTEDGTYENIKIWMASNLYSVNDPTANVVDRYVMFNFDKNGWTCRNTFKLLTSATVKVAYASGLFGFNLSDVDFATCNLGPIPLEAGVRMYMKEQFKQVFINFINNLSVTFRSNTSSYGFITFRTSTNSWKAYFADVQNQAFSADDYITGEAEYIF